MASVAAAQDGPVDLKFFEGRGDVGKVRTPGSAEYDATTKTLKMTASGANIWDKRDDFYFAWKKANGDLMMTADIEFLGKGKDPHRKAGWMVRESLDADAANAGFSVHGDGLIILHYRKEKGGITYEVKSTAKNPATVRLERHGDIFSVLVAKKGGEFQPVGAVTVKLADPVYAGLFLCAHDDSVTESAVFSNLSFSNPKGGKKRVQETSLEVMSVDSGERKVIYKAREKFEAPNWSRDGKLYFNKGGSIYTLPVGGGKPTKLDTGDATQCNNDHGLSADGKWLAISHNIKGASQISLVPSTGGSPRRLTSNKEPSYWHGWSPDGKTLAFCGQRNKEFHIFTVPVEGGAEKQLTSGKGMNDGPDYSPDGKFIYFNSDRTGDMRIWRMNADGSEQTQITKDANFADWFPHPSPDGKWLMWLSFDKSVKDHPANKDVVLRMMPLKGGKTKTLATLFGGQGTINVPSWSPDSKQVAFVSYLQVLP
jgi:Tol biopolymer transport system component/regulation of enolase protein 1 (concanavalin A-like superfamily)